MKELTKAEMVHDHNELVRKYLLLLEKYAKLEQELLKEWRPNERH